MGCGGATAADAGKRSADKSCGPAARGRRGPSRPDLAKLRRTVFALCRERCIGDDLRHDLQRNVTGKTSLAQMSRAEMLAVIARLTGQAVWSPQGMMHELAGRIERGDARLRAFCWERFGRVPDDLRPNETRSAIAFLRNIAPRNV